MKLNKRIKQKISSIRKKLFFYRKEIFCCIQARDFVHSFELPDQIELSEGDVSDVKTIKDIKPELFSDNKFKKFINRINSGHKLIILKLNGNVAGYGWLSFSDFILGVGKIIKLKEGQGAIYDAHTFEEYRGHSIYKCFLYKGIEILKQNGCNVIFSNYDANNYITSHTFNKMGFSIVSTLLLIRFLGFNKLFEKKYAN